MLSGASAATSMMLLQKGERAKMSNAQIALLVIDMAWAKKKLEKDQYKKMKKLYAEVQKETDRELVDMNEFVDKAVDIVKRFETIAPYEMFCGNEKDSYAPIMKQLREGGQDEYN